MSSRNPQSFIDSRKLYMKITIIIIIAILILIGIFKLFQIEEYNQNIFVKCNRLAHSTEETGILKLSYFNDLKTYAKIKNYSISIKVLSKEHKLATYSNINKDLTLSYGDALFIQYNGGFLGKGAGTAIILKVK